MKLNKLNFYASIIELIGMVLLLFGAFWQAKVSGWWDQELPEWQAYIQEDVNFAILSSLKDVAYIAADDNQHRKEQTLIGVQKKLDEGILKALTERTKRSQAIKDGQAATFWKIRDFFMLIGALLVVIAKGVGINAARNASKQDAM